MPKNLQDLSQRREQSCALGSKKDSRNLRRLLCDTGKKTDIGVGPTTFSSWLMIFLTFQAFLLGFGVIIPFLRMVFGSTVAVIANTLPIGGIGNWGTLEIGWAVGFLVTGLSKEQAIATGFGVHILILITCALFELISWVTLKKNQGPSP
ncbi:MAG: lysylphosphatidylglycerol synthase domain-containing protein [Thermodesulfobacteriota bacterium]